MTPTKHYAAIHPIKYTEQPVKKQMGFITKGFQKKYVARPQSIHAIFVAASQGQCIVPADYRVDLNNNYKMQFISSSLIFIDVDDDYKLTDPHKILAQLPHCTGFFYTFSHEKKGNRYRLGFQLSEPIMNLEIYQIMVEIVGREVDALIQYPSWYYEPYKDEKSGKLVTRQPVVDTKPKSPLLPIRTGIMQPVIANLNARLDASHYANLARGIQLQRAEERKKQYEYEITSPIPFPELKKMAETIGYIPSGIGEKELWSRLILGLKHYANTGAITNEQGEELFDIICGGEQAPGAWEKLNPSGRATIGSFIDEAKKRGYKINRFSFGLTNGPREVFPTEYVKVKQHIPTDMAREWLSSKQKLLIESPTGSGKSTSLINAAKQLSEEHSQSFYIFSAPTRPLAKQLASKHNVFLVRGGEKNLWSKVFKAQKDGVRVFVATYDLTDTLIEKLKQSRPKATFHLIVDEYHKTVTDYSSSFRMETLNQLQSAINKSVSVVALSGTPDDILKTSFEKIVKVDNGAPASPCQEFAVYTYEKQKNALPMLVKLVEAWTKRRKLLIYLNNKETNKKLYDILRKRGIVTRTVSAAEKSNATYKQMIEKEMVDHDVQVILATSVIADGINILNFKRDEKGEVILNAKGEPVKDVEWECIVVANQSSKLFNVSLLKQMSNRFRATYRRFSVFMQAPRMDDTDLFQIDSAYNYLNRTASRFAEELNETFGASNLALYRASIVEKRYGLVQNERGAIEVDTHFLRHIASKSKEDYYSSRRHAFIKAMERILHLKVSGILSVDEALKEEEQQQELVQISDIFSDLRDLEKASRAERFERFGEVFTEDVYQSFIDDRTEHLEDIKPLINPEQYNCIKVLHQYTPYELCKTIASQVTRKADSYAFVKRIDALTDVLYFQVVNRNTATKKVYHALLEAGICNEYRSSDELDVVYKKIARMLRVTLDTVKEVAKKLFITYEQRSSTERTYRHESVTFENVAAEFGLSVDLIKSTLRSKLQYQKPAIRAALQRFVMSLEFEQMNLQFA